AMAEVAPRRVLHVLALEPEVAQQTVLGAVGLHELGQVDPAAEVVPRAADHEDLHVVVDVGLVEQVGVAQAHPDRRRVEPVGPVERDRGDLGRLVLGGEDVGGLVALVVGGRAGTGRVVGHRWAPTGSRFQNGLRDSNSGPSGVMSTGSRVTIDPAVSSLTAAVTTSTTPGS